MPSRNLADLDPRFRPLAQQYLDHMASLGHKLIVTATFRTHQEQEVEWMKGRDETGEVVDESAVVTHAPPGHSAHECVDADDRPAALAFDIAVYQPDGNHLDWNPGHPSWQVAHDVARKMINPDGSPVFELGVDWPEPKTDGPHLEMANWKALSLPQSIS